MRLQESSKGRTDSLGVPGPLLRNKWHIFRLIKQIAARAKCWEETKILKTVIKDYFYTSSVQGGQVVVSSSGYKEIGIWILPPQQGKHSLHKAHWSFLLCSKWLAWSHWTPFSGFCPLKHTNLGTFRVCWDPARAARSCYAMCPSSVLSKVPNQGTRVRRAFLSHIQPKSPDAAAAFRSVQSLKWHPSRSILYHRPGCPGCVLQSRVHVSTVCAGEQHPLQPPRLESWGNPASGKHGHPSSSPYGDREFLLN